MQRFREPEIMDDESLRSDLHLEALHGLSRVNYCSFTARTLWQPIRSFARAAGRKISVLDLATGGGDVPISLCALAGREKLDIDFAGCDKSEVAIEYAAKRATNIGRNVLFFKRNVLTETIADPYDITISSLFLHHLDPQDVVQLLSKMRRAQLVLVSDLVRCKPGLALAHIATRLLSRSKIVHVDGPRSVHAAYTRNEMRDMAEQAGMNGVKIETCWPFRMLLSWRRP